MIYASVCDGIGAAHAAWQPLGWRCAWTSEIEPFPAAVVDERWGLPNVGDMTRISDETIREHGPVNLLVGGTPCQSFSVAGLRGGMDDARGNLALEFLRLAQRLRARWIVWENVPGVLSSNGGRDFGAFLGGLAQLGYGFAYRVLDAQYFGLAQRRKRVFVVANIGDWRNSAAVLFDTESMRRNTPPSREEGKEASRNVARCLRARDGTSNLEDYDTYIATPRVAGTLAASGGGLTRTAGNCNELDFCIPVTLAHGQAGAEVGKDMSPTLNCNHEQPIVFGWNKSAQQTMAMNSDMTESLQASPSSNPAIAYKPVGIAGSDLGYTLRANPSHSGDKGDGGINTTMVASSLAVRRLTPLECERLQGFPDEYTLINYRGKPAADGPRYKALGNSMAVPVMAWIGKRIEAVELHTNLA